VALLAWTLINKGKSLPRVDKVRVKKTILETLQMIERKLEKPAAKEESIATTIDRTINKKTEPRSVFLFKIRDGEFSPFSLVHLLV
jgi:hypothetical protein